MCKLVSDKGVADDWTRVRKKQFTKTLLVLNNITIQKSKDQKSQYRTGWHKVRDPGIRDPR